MKVKKNSTTRKSLTKNYIYDILYRIIYIVAPLITTPYISRIIGPTRIGEYSYTQSICIYFAFIAVLGSNIYGQREIAYCGDNKEKRSRVFWEILYIRIIGVLLSSFLYYIICIHPNGQYKVLFLIQILSIWGLLFDVTWLFQGMEKFDIIFFRNAMIKLVSIILIFALVKTREDFYLYVAISVLVVVIGNVSICPELIRYIEWLPLKDVKIKNHIIPIMELFLPTIALRLYDTFDKIMLGLFLGTADEIGYYEQTLKIITIITTFLISIGYVMSPKIASLYASHRKAELDYYINYSLEMSMTLALPLSMGIAAVSGNLVPWFFGSGYERVSLLLIGISPICISIGLKNLIGLQYLVPTQRQNQYTKSIFIGLVINILFNVILIPRYQALGAIVASIISEYVIVGVQFSMIKDEISILNILKLSKWKFTGALVMGIIVYCVSQCLTATVMNTLFLCALGSIVYFSFLLIINDSSIVKIKDQIKKKNRKTSKN